MHLYIPDDIFQASGLSREEIARELALLLYQQNRLTLGYAARIADMYQGDFLELLTDRGINIHYDIEDFQQDIDTLRRLGRLDHLRDNTLLPETSVKGS